MSVRKLLIDLATFVGVMLVLGAIATSCQGAEIIRVMQPSDPALVWVEFDAEPDSTEAMLLVAQRGDAMVPYWSDLSDFVEYGNTWWWVVDFGGLYVGEPVRASFEPLPFHTNRLAIVGEFSRYINADTHQIQIFPGGNMAIVPRDDAWWLGGVMVFRPGSAWWNFAKCPHDSTEATP